MSLPFVHCAGLLTHHGKILSLYDGGGIRDALISSEQMRFTVDYDKLSSATFLLQQKEYMIFVSFLLNTNIVKLCQDNL